MDRINTRGGSPAATAVIVDSSEWANDAPGDQGDCDGTDATATVWPPDLDQHLDDWRAFVARFVERYEGPGAEHPSSLVAIEAWNEPNKASFWKGGDQSEFDPQPHHFARLVEAASVAVRASSAPGVKVFPGGLSPGGSSVEQYMRDATDPGFAQRIRQRPHRRHQHPSIRSQLRVLGQPRAQGGA